MKTYLDYLIYYVNKKEDGQGQFNCGLYKVVTIETDKMDNRETVERKAIKKWQAEADCLYLEIELEATIYDAPVWSAVNVHDEGQDNDAYYIVVQALPNKISK